MNSNASLQHNKKIKLIDQKKLESVNARLTKAVGLILA